MKSYIKHIRPRLKLKDYSIAIKFVIVFGQWDINGTNKIVVKHRISFVINDLFAVDSV